MDRYKIKLLRASDPTTIYGEVFLHVTHRYLESILTEPFNPDYTYLPYTSDMFDKEEDLDLIMANVWYNKLTNLGVKCEIVKIDYPEE